MYCTVEEAKQKDGLYNGKKYTEGRSVCGRRHMEGRIVQWKKAYRQTDCIVGEDTRRDRLYNGRGYTDGWTV